MRKNPVASKLRKIREQGFSTAYHDLVDDLDDWPGMIAYCQYKEDKKQACETFAGKPDDLNAYLRSYQELTSERIRQLKENARARVRTYAQAAVDEAKPEIERERLNKELLKNSRNQFLFGILASFIAYLGAITLPDFFEWFAQRDAGAQVQQLRTDIQRLTFAVERGTGLVEPAAGAPPAESQSGMIETELPAVPEIFRDETVRPMALERSEDRQEVWKKANYAGETNENQGFRKDLCGAWIRFADYDDRRSDYGWSTGLLLPSFPRSAETIDDLQPMHWKNAEDSSRSWQCAVTSDGEANLPVTPKPRKPSSP